jgi:hypothetical protein
MVSTVVRVFGLRSSGFDSNQTNDDVTRLPQDFMSRPFDAAQVLPWLTCQCLGCADEQVTKVVAA